MSSVQLAELLRDLHKNILDKKARLVDVEETVEQLEHFWQHMSSSTDTEQQLVRQSMLDWLVPAVRHVTGDKSLGDFCYRSVTLIQEQVVEHSRLSMDQAGVVYYLAVRCFAMGAAVRLKVASLMLLQKLFAATEDRHKAAQHFDLSTLMEKHFFALFGKSASASTSLLQALGSTLGVLCSSFSEAMKPYADQVKLYLMAQLQEQMTSRTQKLQLGVIEASLVGLKGYLHAFSGEMSNAELDQLYQALMQVCVLPDKTEAIKRIAMRAGLDLFAEHCALFSQQLVKRQQAEHWFRVLKQWASSFYAKDHKIGWKCLEAFFRTMGKALQQPDQHHPDTFTYLMGRFTAIFRSQKASSKEIILAVQGYSHLASACGVYMSDQAVSHMLSELVQKAEEVFMSQQAASVAMDASLLVHLPSYVEGVCVVLQHLHLPITEAVLVPIKQVVATLMNQLPNLPEPYRPFAMRALKQFFSVMQSGSLPCLLHCEDALNDVVYLGLLHICSYPVVLDTTSNEMAMYSGVKVVCTHSYLPFWADLLTIRAVFDSFMHSLLVVIDKLHLTLVNGPDGPDEQVQDASYVSPGDVVPERRKDYTILTNLVEVAQHVLPRYDCNRAWMDVWMYKVVSALMTKITVQAKASGLYLLLSCVLKEAHQYFQVRPAERLQMQAFLQELVLKCVHFHHDLLHACLQLILDLPAETFVEALLADLCGPLSKVFQAWQPIELVEKGVDALCRWLQCLDRQRMKPMLRHLLPRLNSYMKDSRSEMLEESKHLLQPDHKSGHPSNGSSSSSSSEQDLDYERIQKKLLLLFGALDTDLLPYLIPSQAELCSLATAPDLHRHLRLEVPLPDLKPAIHLDNLLPRVVALSKEAKQRKTRVAAAECLHAITLFLIGNSATHEAYYSGSRSLLPLYQSVLPALVQLASDNDKVIKDLFQPLLLQTIHWFTRPAKQSRPETKCLLESILEAICHPDRDMTCKTLASSFLAEFFHWSVKQTSYHATIDHIQHPKAVIKLILSLWTHPHASRRQAASLAFNSIYRIFREEQALADNFTLDLVVRALQGLSLCHYDRQLASDDAAEQTKASLDHLLRILTHKAHRFQAVEADRRRPVELAGPLLSHLVQWLLGWWARTEHEARHKAIELSFQLSSVCGVSLKHIFDGYVADQCDHDVARFLEAVESNQLPGVDAGCLAKPPASPSRTRLVQWLDGLIGSLECYCWLLQQNLVDLDTVTSWLLRSQLLPALDFFIRNMKSCSMNESKCFGQHLCPDSSEAWTPRCILDMNRLCCTLLVRLFKFAITLKKQHPDERLLQRLWTDEFMQLVMLSVLLPEQVGFNVADRSVLASLRLVLKQVLEQATCRPPQHTWSLMRWLASLPEHHQPEHVIQATLSGRASLLSSPYLSGLHMLHTSRLLDVWSVYPALMDSALHLPHMKSESGDLMSPEPVQMSAQAQLLELALQTCAKRSEHVSRLLLIPSTTSAKTMPAALGHVVLAQVSSQWESVLPAVLHDLLTTDRIQMRQTIIQLATFFYKESVNPAAVDRLLRLVMAKPAWTSIVSGVQPLAAAHHEDRLWDVLLLKQLLLLDQKRGATVASNAEVLDWYMTQLSSQNSSLKIKNHFLELLTPFVVCHPDSPLISDTLHSLANHHFPLTSEEYPEGSSLLSDYLVCVGHLSRCLQDTADCGLLRFLVDVVCREPSHAALDGFVGCLGRMMRKSGGLDRLPLLSQVFDLFVSTPDIEVRGRLVDQVLLPMLDGAEKSAVLSRFFELHMDFLLESMLTSLSDGDRKAILTTKTGCCKLLAKMYSKVSSKEQVHGRSPITKSAFHKLSGRVAEVKAGADYAGREMSQFLVKRLKSVRAEAIDGSDQLMQLFRKFQCEAYNAMMAIIARLQDKEAFYNAYIFKEDFDKGELIWARIVDLNPALAFPLELDAAAATRKKCVAVQQSLPVGLHQPHVVSPALSTGHFLLDSSFSQDVLSSRYDFHDSFVSSSGDGGSRNPQPGADQTPEALNVMELEWDGLNRHECMTSLMQLLNIMKANRVYDDQAVTALPGWMESVVQTLTCSKTHRNVALFLLRLILNCGHIFEPFAAHLGKALLAILARADIWCSSPSGELINYFSLDVLVLVLSWHGNYQPTGSVFERADASHLWEAVARTLFPKRPITAHLFSVLQLMTRVWQAAITLPYAWLQQLITSESDEVRLQGLQIMHLILSNESPDATWAAASGPDPPLLVESLSDAVPAMHSRHKSTAILSAKVLGLALHRFTRKPDQGQRLYEDLLQVALKQLRKLKDSALASGRVNELNKFVCCLFHASQHHNQLVASFAGSFIYSLRQPQLKGEALEQCLIMLGWAVDFVAQQVSESGSSSWKPQLNMIGIQSLFGLTDVRHKLPVLQFVLQCLRSIKHSCPESVALLFSLVKPDAKHAEVQCRQMVFQIAQWLYDAKSCPDIDDQVRLCLMSALSDDHGGIVASTVAFFNHPSRLTDSRTGLRMVQAIGLLARSEDADHSAFLKVLPDLILSLSEKSPDFCRKVFAKPLEEITFEEQRIDTSWRHQFVSSTIPRWVDTLSSQTQAASTITPGAIRATQNHWSFALTQTQQPPITDPSVPLKASLVLDSVLAAELRPASQTQNLTNAGRTSFRQDDPLFGSQTLQPGAVLEPAVAGPDCNQASIRLQLQGKRFVKAAAAPDDQKERHELTKARFARQHSIKLTRQQELHKDRRGRRQAEVMLMRRYRVGELPDIEMTYSDLIKLLINLSYRDEQVARRLCVDLCLAVIEDDDHSPTIRDQMHSALVAVVSEATSLSRSFAATVMEILLGLGQGVPSSCSANLTSICKSLELQSLGILLAERQLLDDAGVDMVYEEPAAKRKRLAGRLDADHDRAALIHLVGLYRSVGDLWSAGEVVQQYGHQASVLKALSLDTMAQWSESKKMWKLVLEEEQRGLYQEQEASLWKENYVNSLKCLSDWPEMDQFLSRELQQSEAQLWQPGWTKEFLLPATIHCQLHLAHRLPQLMQMVDSARGDPVRKRNFDHRFSFELGLMYAHKSQLADAAVWLEQAMTKCLSHWTQSNDFNLEAQLKACVFLPRLRQLHDAVSGKELLQELLQRPGEQDDLCAWDDLLNDRCLLLGPISHHGTKAQGYLDLAQESVSRSDYHFAVNQLTLAKRELSLIKDSKPKELMHLFDLTFYQIAAAKCQYETSLTPDTRFNALYRTLINLEQNTNFSNKATIKARIYHVLAGLVRSMATNFDPDACLSSDDKKIHFRQLFSQLGPGGQPPEAADISFRLEKFAVDTLLQADDSQVDKFVLASYFRSLWKEFPSHRTSQLAASLIQTHLTAMASGSAMAAKLFPDVLSLLEELLCPEPQAEYADCVTNTFVSVANGVPAFMFLQWLDQMLSLLGHAGSAAMAPLVGPILMTLVDCYPEAVRVPFEFTLSKLARCHNQQQVAFISAIRDKLRSKSSSLLADKVMRELAFVAEPVAMLKNLLNLIRDAGDQRLEAVHELRCRFLSGDSSRPAFDAVLKDIRPDLERLVSIHNEAGPRAKELVNSLLTRLQKTRSRPSVQLKDYSGFLHSFHMSSHVDTVEMFGQYDGHLMTCRKPDPDNHVKIASFGATLSIFSSIRKPIKVEMIGDDGKHYAWIVKTGEDLRQDQRVQQVFHLVNGITKRQAEQQRRIRPITTYCVVPLSPCLGLIYFVSNTVTYKSLVQAAGVRQPPGNVAVLSAKDFDLSLKDPNRARQFCQYVQRDLAGCPDLKQSFQRMSSSPEAFFYLRQNFLRSHGTASIAAWLMSIGDRHADNCLVSKESGDSIPIDFGHAFGSALFLPIPELVPFRVTPQIWNLMLPFVRHGPLRDAMIQTLKLLRDHRDVLVATLSVFAREPTLDWLHLAKRMQPTAGPSPERDGCLASKALIVDKKLSGANPCTVLLEEYGHANAKVPRLVKDLVLGRFRGPNVYRRQEEDGVCLDAEQQVDVLLELATDAEVLCRCFAGWSPWS